ncbi:MAG: PQQ-binding-like beta-propeller repeat protein [Phycisphaerae bacterium]|nr:PQQ-binding-like beta-propeller repeat protein [Phycisphaerae bacterium]
MASACVTTLADASVQSTNATSPAADAAVNATQTKLDAVTAELDREYIIGPTIAKDLDLRIAWQSRLAPNGGPLKYIATAEDAILVLDSRNGIARLNPANGAEMWRVSVANEIDIFRGLHWARIQEPRSGALGAPLERRDPRETAKKPWLLTLYLATDTELHAIDAATGSLVDRQNFEKLPATPPLGVGPYLIYGTIGGQLVWHDFVLGHELRANSLDSKSRPRPLLVGNSVIAVSDRGMVLCADAKSATTRWTTRTLGGIVARPAAGSGMIFVPSQDQYLWAFDARSGAPRWRYFTQSELVTPPYAFEDSVLQYVPTEGLVCLAADAKGKIDGVVRWRNDQAHGVPQGIIDGLLLLWDGDKHLATTVDPKTGVVLDRYSLPSALMIDLVEEGPLAGDLLTISEDGRVERLTSLAPKAPAPAAAAAGATK